MKISMRLLWILCLIESLGSIPASEDANSFHKIVKRAVAKKQTLTVAQKKKILDEHNNLRGKVEPTAANMFKLTWNTTLEKIAVDYSRKCIFDHNKTPYGENLYASTAAVGDAGDFAVKGIKNWFDERKGYNYETRACSVKACGHYTQVAWATTKQVGCGLTTCKPLKASGLGDATATIFVCNYAPAGNIGGMKIYQRGTPCTACPNAYQCNATEKLCFDPTYKNVFEGNAGHITGITVGVLALASIFAALMIK